MLIMIIILYYDRQINWLLHSANITCWCLALKLMKVAIVKHKLSLHDRYILHKCCGKNTIIEL